MGARGWGFAMAALMVAGVAISIVGLFGGPHVTMWVAPPFYLLSFACCVRMIDHLGSAGETPRFSWLGWLRD